MPIQLPENIKPAQRVFTNTFDYVDLPFPYLRLSWNNGHHLASQNEKAKHFGGFQRGENDIKEDLASMGQETLPSYFSEPTTWLSEDGREYLARSSRHLYAAPILAKVDWRETDEVNPQTGKKKRKHRLDFLVYLGTLTDKKLVQPWGPAVISAHGWAATDIEDAFKAWDKDSQDGRNKFAPGVDAMFFYNIIGTFGEKRVTRPAGEKKFTAICQYSHPDSWSEEYLAKLFVGENIAAVLVDFQVQAKEWVEDTWENRQKAGKPTKEQPQESVRIGAQPPDNFEDELPF